MTLRAQTRHGYFEAGPGFGCTSPDINSAIGSALDLVGGSILTVDKKLSLKSLNVTIWAIN